MQLIDLSPGGLGVRLRRFARLSRRDRKGLQRLSHLRFEGFSLPGAHFDEDVERGRGRNSELVALRFGGLGELGELACRGLDELGHGLGAQGGRLVESADVPAGALEELRKPRGARFGQGGEVLLIRAQGVGDGHQGGALLPETFLHRPQLLADAEPSGLEAGDLPRQVIAGRAGDIRHLAGRGGQVGGARRQSLLRLVQLRLCQIRGLRHHAGLAVYCVCDRRGAGVQGQGQGIQLGPLAGQAFDERARIGLRGRRRFGEAQGFGGKGFMQLDQSGRGRRGGLGPASALGRPG